MHKPIGSIYNESQCRADHLTGRTIRQLTASGLFSQGPTYHFGACFIPETGEALLIHDTKESRYLCAANPENGDLRVLARTDSSKSLSETAGPACWYPNATALCHGNNSGVLLASRQKIWLLDSVTQPGEPRLLYCAPSGQQFGEPASSHDGTATFVWMYPIAPQAESIPKTYEQMSQRDDMQGVLLRIDNNSGKTDIICAPELARSNHVQPHPHNTWPLLSDFDLPPWYHWFGDHGESSRMALVSDAGTHITPLPPRADKAFQIHSTWSYQGDMIYYHGRSEHPLRSGTMTNTKHYIGACKLDGSIVWEREYPTFYYGHVSGHPQQNSIIIDGLITPIAALLFT